MAFEQNWVEVFQQPAMPKMNAALSRLFTIG